MKNFIEGLRSYQLAHSFIKTHRLWWYMMVPMLVNAAIISGIIWVVYRTNTHLSATVEGWFDFNPESTWYDITNIALHFVTWLILVVVYFYLYKTLVLIILSPFLAFLSEKIDALYTRREYPFTWKQFFRDIGRGIRLSLRNTLLEFLIILLLLFLGVVPIVGLLSPLLIFGVESFYFGFSMLDYSLEREKYSVRESHTFVRRNRFLALSVGVGFYAMFLIPVIGWVIAPTYGIVAGTLAILRKHERDGTLHIREEGAEV